MPGFLTKKALTKFTYYTPNPEFRLYTPERLSGQDL